MKKGNVYLFSSIILAVIIYATTILILDKNKVIDAGTFGDMFGALNTLFTGLAFVGVVISLFQQNEALKQQQEALQEQKEELKLYKGELEKNNFHLGLQIRNQQTQKFETTFFNLINIYKVNVSELRTSNTHNYGLDLIRETVDIYQNKEYPYSIDMFRLRIHIHTIIPEYKNIYEQVIFIIKFIEKESTTEDDRNFYGNLLANQMSINEKICLTALLGHKGRDNPDNVEYIKDCFERYNILYVAS